ncbi:MAG: hypothetical protein ACI8UR_000526 [Natronomonas sp.]|jgi:hypothetical protein|uniref:transcriptional regulator TbsP domain-containing protein n=1 Tax=Natronomonas sp. TaxID=2184060 RepID=UPI003988D81D
MDGRDNISAREEAVSELLTQLSDDAYLTASALDDVAAIVSVLESTAPDADVRLLVDERTAREVRNAFVVASKTAAVMDESVLEVRSVDSAAPFTTLLVGAESIVGLAAVAGSVVTTLEAEAEAERVEAARDAFTDRWAEAEDFSVRAPAYSRMLSTLEERLGESVRGDTERLFEQAVEERASRELDPVRLTLLVGAAHEVQFYELGLWGESEDVASRAKFSREKQQLEAHDLVDTEKIPSDIGRPRQRLVLGDAVAGADADEAFEAARETLGS